MSLPITLIGKKFGIENSPQIPSDISHVTITVKRHCGNKQANKEILYKLRRLTSITILDRNVAFNATLID